MDNQLKQFISATGGEDLGRIVRSDMTRLTEMMHKYRSLAQGAADEVASQIQDSLHSLANARQALLHVSAVASGYAVPDLAGPGVDAGDAPKPAASDIYTIAVPGGRPMLLSAVLGAAGFVSSSAVAKKGIKMGRVMIDGEMTPRDAPLELDTVYSLTCGEITAKVKLTAPKR